MKHNCLFCEDEGDWSIEIMYDNNVRTGLFVCDRCYKKDKY